MEKIIKIQPHYYFTNQGKTSRKVPKLTIQGDWLSYSGFSPDQSVLVCVSEKEIKITPLPREETEYIRAQCDFNRKYKALVTKFSNFQIHLNP